MMKFWQHDEPIGIPIGNLLSQLFALIFLNPLDHFIKRILKVKSYCRYVDDFVILNNSKPLFANKSANVNILRIFMKRNELIRKKMLLRRFFLSIGVLKFKIKSK